MNFNETLEALKAGKIVKRSDWEDGFCCLMPDQHYIWRVLTKPQANVGNFLPTLDDYKAHDWMSFEPGVSTVAITETLGTPACDPA